MLEMFEVRGRDIEVIRGLSDKNLLSEFRKEINLYTKVFEDNVGRMGKKRSYVPTGGIYKDEGKEVSNFYGNLEYLRGKFLYGTYLIKVREESRQQEAVAVYMSESGLSFRGSAIRHGGEFGKEKNYKTVVETSIGGLRPIMLMIPSMSEVKGVFSSYGSGIGGKEIMVDWTESLTDVGGIRRMMTPVARGVVGDTYLKLEEGGRNKYYHMKEV